MLNLFKRIRDCEKITSTGLFPKTLKRLGILETEGELIFARSLRWVFLIILFVFVKGGKIDVGVDMDKDLILKVSDYSHPDDIYPSTQVQPGEQKGIENIKNRLKLIYGTHAKFTVQKYDSGAVSQIVINDVSIRFKPSLKGFDL